MHENTKRLSFLFRIQIAQAREALEAKGLTQRQLIEQIERKLDQMEEQSGGPKKE